jgi:thiol-disulfide isomerase/thioredoxin
MKLILIMVCICFCTMGIRAQTNGNTNPQPRAIELNKTAISDSSGQVYSADLVSRLLATGKYGIKWDIPLVTGILYRLSEEQIAAIEKRMPKPIESKFFKTGKKIYNFNDKDMGGNKYNIKELIAAGKIIVLNFWFVNCPPCRMEMPQLNELVESYKSNQDIVFIAISLDYKYEINEFLKSNPFNYHIIENGRYIASQYGITTYPTHAVLNKKGEVIFHTSGLGRNTIPWVKKSIEAALHDALPE